MTDAEKLAIAIDALEYYAAHPSVIKEAFHSNDQNQITCVHTFINHVARAALEKIKTFHVELDGKNIKMQQSLDDFKAAALASKIMEDRSMRECQLMGTKPGDTPPHFTVLP